MYLLGRLMASVWGELWALFRTGKTPRALLFLAAIPLLTYVPWQTRYEASRDSAGYAWIFNPPSFAVIDVSRLTLEILAACCVVGCLAVVGSRPAKSAPPQPARKREGKVCGHTTLLPGGMCESCRSSP